MEEKSAAPVLLPAVMACSCRSRLGLPLEPSCEWSWAFRVFADPPYLQSEILHHEIVLPRGSCGLWNLHSRSLLRGQQPRKGGVQWL